MMIPEGTPVTERALAARLARRLRHTRDARLCRCSARARGFDYLGTYYLLDGRTGGVVLTHVDLVDWARTEGLMHPNERLQS